MFCILKLREEEDKEGIRFLEFVSRGLWAPVMAEARLSRFNQYNISYFALYNQIRQSVILHWAFLKVIRSQHSSTAT
jgi:hypothetical protein